MKPLRRILLAEDSDADIELTLSALAEHNLANLVDVARDGVEALEYLRARLPINGRHDSLPILVLMDIKMPRLTGIEVLRQMKSDPMLRTIPVVVVTSSREEPDLQRCYELGVNAYVVKPVGFVEFIDAVKQIGAFWAVLNEPPPSRPTD
jgi:two-component system response regulator